MIDTCLIRHTKKNHDYPTHAVFLLHGRGGTAEQMLHIFEALKEINNLVIFSLETEKEWYPLPNGIHDQSEAVNGLSKNLPKLREYISKTLFEHKIKLENTILIGFSAGAVMALELAIRFQDSYKMVFCHSGAILEPENVQKCRISTKIMLIHHEDDICFSWEERYLPMRESLDKNGYNLEICEKIYGNHLIFKDDVIATKNLINEFVA